MDIEFDSTKDEINRQKHNLPLAFGAVVLANKVGEVEDTRRDYGERRMKTYAGSTASGLNVATRCAVASCTYSQSIGSEQTRCGSGSAGETTIVQTGRHATKAQPGRADHGNPEATERG
ncbi:MAG TPA: hypothetical protein VE690_22010 [Rhodopila sp.]|nr:hypothetical protein [Rhodopila sp.]